MTNSVVVVGSYNTDLTIKTKRIPRPGETVIDGVFSRGGGGKGANQAVAAARLGASVCLIARLGDDPLGREALARLIDEDINTQHVLLDAHVPTGVAFIVVDEHGENSIVVASGANSRLTPVDIEKANDVIASARVLLIPLETPLDAIRSAVALAHRTDSLVILNPAPVQPLDEKLLSAIDILTPNSVEAEMLTGVKITDAASLRAASKRLLECGVGKVLITLGKRGVFFASAENEEWIPAFKVQAVDSTGAGDVFNGALAAFLAEGTTVELAIRKASAAAAIAVTRMGAQVSAPRRSEIEQFMHTHIASQPEAIGS
jgi:ribokinase